MKLTLLKITLPVLALTLANVASAATIITLNSGGTLTLGNANSTFYEASGLGVESGTGAALFSVALGGNSVTGFTVTFTQTSATDVNLTSAFIKAANDHILWDSTDLAGWNALNSTTGDQLVLVNNLIANAQGVFQGTSHAGLNGSPGTGVPDGGTTVAMLGLVLGLVAFAKRKFRL